MYGYNQKCFHAIQIRRVCRYQRGNQNPYIEEEQTTQWSKEKLQNDKQRSTKQNNSSAANCTFHWKRGWHFPKTNH
jgi:hypothetical protein